MNFNQTKESNKQDIHQQRLDLDREKMNNETRNKQLELAIAKENKNKFDTKKPNK